MPRANRRSRSEQVQDEKGDRPGWYTSQELQKYLGWSESKFKRALRAGIVPPAEARTEHGWQLWSPEVARSVLDSVLYPRKSRETT